MYLTLSNEESKQIKFDQFIGILERGMDILQSFGKSTPELTIADVAKITGYSRASCRRILLTYNEIGFIQYDGKHFSLSPKILTLGFSFLFSQPITEVARPILKKINRKLKEGCSLTIYENGEIVYLVRIEGERVMPATIGIGGRFPAYFTSMGRVFLSDLSTKELDSYFESTTLEKITPKTEVAVSKLRKEIARAKKNGYAICQDQVEIGHTSLAVPLYNSHNELVAAINIVTHTWRTPKRKLIDEYLPILLESSKEISKFLI